MALTLHQLVAQRIALLDGAMGTAIQQYDLEEADFRGKEFASHARSQGGNNDLLTLTRPQVIEEIHRSHLSAGADRNALNITSGG